MTGEVFLLAAASCLMIADPDHRSYCRALELGRVTDCSAILSLDLRIRCRVELDDNPSNCASIINESQRALCQAKWKK